MTRLERLEAKMIKAGEDRDAALEPVNRLSVKLGNSRAIYERMKAIDPNSPAVTALDDEIFEDCSSLNEAIAGLEAKQKAMLRAQAEFDSAQIAAAMPKQGTPALMDAANVVKLGLIRRENDK